MKYYDTIAPGYDRLHGEEQKKKLEVLKKELPVKRTDKLLDVGCGTGISMDFPCIVFGVDPSLELLKLNKNKRLFHGYAEALPFKDKLFDYVIALTSIHNFKDYKLGLNEIKRVCKKKYGFSLLKNTKNFDEILDFIAQNFKIIKKIDSDIDLILICEN